MNAPRRRIRGFKLVHDRPQTRTEFAVLVVLGRGRLLVSVAIPLIPVPPE
jgi:hypothetical protein